MMVVRALAGLRRCAGGFLVGVLLAGISPEESGADLLQGDPDLSIEFAEALVTPDRPGEALAFVQQRLALISAANQPPPVPTSRRTLLRRQRPGTISLGFQGSYGIVRGTSRLADGFSDGFGYALRFRYMLSPSFALGFSFENQQYDQRGGAPSTTPGASDSMIVMTTVSAEGVLFLHREREAHPYFLAGIGHAAPDVVDESLGTSRVNEGMYLVLGAGFERFFRPRFSMDLTVRGYAMISNSEFTSFAQFCAGIHLYPGD